jgi:predicted ATPase
MASGMLLALALLWMVYRPDGDRMICFDEPENSVHPHLLRYVYDLLKGLTRPEKGRAPVQVLVATHSVDFVNLCEPDEIRICERSDDGSVQIESVKDKKDLAQAIDSYRGAMGELWFSGALGGLPSHGTKSSRTG